MRIIPATETMRIAQTTYRARSFVMIEVIVALTILSIGLTGMLNSFALSLKALRRENIITTSIFLANYLIENYQNDTPLYAYDSGDFGEGYPDYVWDVDVESEQLSYRVDSEWMEKNQHLQVWVTLRVWYVGMNEREPYLGIELTTCLMRFERYSKDTIKYLVDEEIFNQ